MPRLSSTGRRNRQDEGIKFALSSGVLDAFTIGAESKQEQQDLMRRIAEAQKETWRGGRLVRPVR